MEPILMHLEAGGSSGEDDPHDGEEFGYVISGSIYLYLGSRKYRVKRGESFYFRPTVAHRIENAGKSKAVVLWISSPPSF
jgi:quercetin dioxygenase-like cupin family protein